MRNTLYSPIIETQDDFVSIKNPSKRSDTIKIYKPKVPIKSNGRNLNNGSLNLEKFITDFKSIRNSDFGYDTTSPHFLDFLQSK